MRAPGAVTALTAIALLTSPTVPAPAGQRPTLVISDCDDAGPWSAGELVDEPVRQGNGAIRWHLVETGSLSITDIPHDWSAYNALSFRLFSERATGSPLWLILSSDDPQREGPDYYSLRLKLDYEGWKRFTLPFDEIGAVRRPLGWNNIQRLMFHAAWNPNVEIDPGAVVVLDDVRLIEYSDKGPRMTDEEFFDALDLDLPGLEQVQAAVARGDLEAAKAAWADYLRHRDWPRWFTDWHDRPPPRPVEKVNTTIADLALDHIFRWGRRNFDLGEDIDWSQNQMTEGESATIEWNARLNRHPMFQALAKAWYQTGERKYTDELVAQMVDWIEDAPVLLNSSGNHPYHWAWETLNTACRASSAWPDAVFQTLDSPSWTDEALVMVTKSMAEHARHLLAHPTSRNWLTAESTGLFDIGVLFPEYREAAQWRRVAVERLYQQMDTEVYPDGPEDELALGYGMWVLRNYGAVLDLAILNDRKGEIPTDWLAKIEAMYNYVLYITMPNGIAPGLNDSGNVNTRPILEKGFGYFPHRTDFQWIATEGAEGAVPEHTSYALPYCGHYVMRSGWDPDDLYMLLDAGPFGSGHQHEDKLTFVLYAHGQLQVVDGGSYMYDHSRWRRYVLSTRGHNTVMVDGLDQRRRKVRSTWTLPHPFEPLDNPWARGRDFAP
ncbi:MAG: alginate lyase family protein, partial [Armatimonadetes bacterium]|nr:alginate lyase family protein [Armatimonadota bacterium]